MPTSAAMSVISRSCLAFVAIGTGLIHLALVIGAPLALGIPLALLGLIEFGWGVVTFAGSSVPAPRAVLAVALLPILAWGLLLAGSSLVGSSPRVPALPALPLAITMVFELAAGVTLALHLRQHATSAASDDSSAPGSPDAPRTSGLGRTLIAILAGGAIVAALTTTALSATRAGLVAQPHTTEAPLLLPSHAH